MDKAIIVTHAKKLRFLRKHHDKKQTELANFLGLSQQAYSKLENGETIFSDETIEKLSNFFGISPAEFEHIPDNIYIGNNSHNHSSNSHTMNERLLKAYEALFAQNQKLFEDLVREKDQRIKLLERLLNSDDI